MKLKLVLVCLGFVINLGAQNSDKADQLYATGNYAKAIKAYKTSKDVETVLAKIAKSYIAIGNYEEGLSYYIKAIEANSDDALLKYDYAKLLSRTKSYEAANSIFSNLIKNDSLNPNYHYELGLVLQKQKDTTAHDEFLKTFDLDATHQKAIFKVAKQLIIKRKFEEAHRFLDKGLESYANNVELISLKAQAYYFQEYYTHAVVWFNKLIDLGEVSEFIHEKLSLSYAQNSDYQDAIKHRKLVLNYSPKDANAMFVIGGYYQRISDFENAEKFISAALQLQDVSLSEEYQTLGTILNRQKKYEAAIKAFQKSLKEDASNIMAEFFLLRTKDEFYADIDTKITMYEKYLAKHKKSMFLTYAERRLKELKEEKFLQED
ncbi:tetratricopeptide repeat protein [Winogradskyella sp. UBA3174]|uniref:tetratricopeptide repeat protein n=1 Tax=Winogradskyella sp. UBA3174 TaxID=1947785 RepID=UPI0025F989A5|nr:tetratricopeptide repeat protein [Winogradskyella sp. UBA3174]|tara:strand:- start:16436 stop:17563 length:1128 start_codon:yes stop_codon:yes gene_type:complete